jgi:hypothetical protein
MSLIKLIKTNQKHQTILINIMVMGGLYVIPYLFKMDKGHSNVSMSYPKAFFLLSILIFLFLGLIAKSPIEIKSDTIKSYTILSIMGFFGNMFIIGGMLMYFGLSKEESEPFAILPPLILAFTEGYILVYPFDKKRKKKEKEKILHFNNMYLTLYSVLGFSYVWHIALYFANFNTTNILLIIAMFIFIGLPFRRFFILDELEQNKTRLDKFFLFLSYVLMFIVSIHQYL